MPESYILAIKLLLFWLFTPKLLLLPLKTLLLFGTATTLYRTLNATGNVTVVSRFATSLFPHCKLKPLSVSVERKKYER
nr:MAG TPA_asm: hypothetical protein [Caudoviricetes sp.]